jgi:hypothetical protein
MLSVFPEILFLSPLAATLIRAALALLFAYTAWYHIERSDIASRVLGVVELIAAGLLLAGAWAQPAALVGAVIVAIWYFQPSSRVVAVSSIGLAFIMCLAVLFTGPGALAFDLPL